MPLRAVIVTGSVFLGPRAVPRVQGWCVFSPVQPRTSEIIDISCHAPVLSCVCVCVIFKAGIPDSLLSPFTLVALIAGEEERAGEHSGTPLMCGFDAS